MKKQPIKYIFEGVYQNFEQVPVVGDGFSGSVWNKKARERAEELIKHPVAAHRDNLLPFLASIVSRGKSKIGVLDVGGGPGFGFLPTVSVLGKGKKVSFYIIDTQKICELGREIFGKDKRISFYRQFPKKVPGVDIVHFGSSIQYFADWKEILKKVSKYGANYILFSDLHAGNVPTYATAQIYYGSRIPSWFFNLDEFIDRMRVYGYSLIFKADQLVKYLGRERKLPQNNFPKKYRVGNTAVLLFAKKN